MPPPSCRSHAATNDGPSRSGKAPDDQATPSSHRLGKGPGGGEERLRAALRSRGRRARNQDPRPYDDDWGWWIEARMARLEKGQTWLIRVAISALAAEILRIILLTTGIGS